MDNLNSLRFIAEAGVNHNGSLDKALKLVDAAKSCGADIVKFQLFQANKLADDSADLAGYQKKNLNNTLSQKDMLSNLELSSSDIVTISKHCEDVDIEFLATAFDSESLNLLINETNIKMIKIPSGEITNAPLLIEYSKANLPIIMSTGMCGYKDIETALSVLAYGLQNLKTIPSLKEFESAYNSIYGQKVIKEKVKLLHCTSEYPAPISQSNLLSIKSLNSAFGIEVGFSDHTLGYIASVVALTFGSKIFEKHITLDKSMEGPDHKASMEPKEYLEYIKMIKLASKSIGTGVKIPTEDELKNQALVRKSLVASKDLKKDHIIKEDDISIIRSKHGSSPYDYWSLIGQKLKKSTKKGSSFKT